MTTEVLPALQSTYRKHSTAATAAAASEGRVAHICILYKEAVVTGDSATATATDARGQLYKHDRYLDISCKYIN